jgi:hypothetical protein
MAAEFFLDKSLNPAVSGFLHRVADSAATALIVTPAQTQNLRC